MSREATFQLNGRVYKGFSCPLLDAPGHGVLMCKVHPSYTGLRNRWNPTCYGHDPFLRDERHKCPVHEGGGVVITGTWHDMEAENPFAEDKRPMYRRTRFLEDGSEIPEGSYDQTNWFDIADGQSAGGE